MKIAVIGSPEWTDYNHLMRTLTVAIQDWRYYYPDDTTLEFVHTGMSGAESMVIEYVGKVEDLAKQNGYKITEYKFKSRDLEELVNSDITWSIIFSKDPCARCNVFAKLSRDKDIPVSFEKG